MKKPSAAKPREETIVFFVDRSLGRFDVPNALKEAGYRCELHDDHFSAATEDAEWLRRIAAQQWVVLTKDERIRYRPLELRALRTARLRAFIVVCGNVRGAETAAILVKAMPRILSIVRAQKGPFIYRTRRSSHPISETLTRSPRTPTFHFTPQQCRISGQWRGRYERI